MKEKSNELDTFTLPNGMRVVHRRVAWPVTYSGVCIDAGSRDEGRTEQGMAHYVEHMLFKGTERRRAWHILNRMETVGGDLNATTDKEETTVYCAHLAQDFARAAELLADITLHSTFPEEEMEREVEVICDEIESYEDSPAELIYDEFDGVLFGDHSLGRCILGKAEELRAYRREDLIRFVKRLYRPERMVFFVVGDVEKKEVRKACEKWFETEGATEAPITPIHRRDDRSGRPSAAWVHDRMASTLSNFHSGDDDAKRIEIERGTHQAHVMMGSIAYPAGDRRNPALRLLTNILAGPGMNSWLNVELRERRGLVYTIEASRTAYTDTGSFTLYYGCDREDVARCRRLVQRTLRRVCEQPLSEGQLRAAKRQLVGQIGVAGDNYEQIALDMAKVFLHYGVCVEKEEVIRRIQAVTAEDVWEVARDVLGDLKELVFL
jgi:predicted Zn-dependent peptidase